MSMRVRSWVGNPGHGNRWPSDRPGSMRSRPRWRLRTRLTWPETRTRHQRSFNPETAEPSVVCSIKEGWVEAQPPCGDTAFVALRLSDVDILHAHPSDDGMRVIHVAVSYTHLRAHETDSYLV